MELSGEEEKGHEVERSAFDISSDDDQPAHFGSDPRSVAPTPESADSYAQCPHCSSPGAPSSTGATSGFTSSDEFSAESCCSLGPRRFEHRFLQPSRVALYDESSYWSTSNCARCGQPGAFCVCPRRYRLNDGAIRAGVLPVLVFALSLMCGMVMRR